MHSFSLPASYFAANSLDHLNYQRHGFPAMVITDTSEHRAIRMDEKPVVERLDYEKMAMLVQGLYQVVMDNESTVVTNPDPEMLITYKTSKNRGDGF